MDGGGAGRDQGAEAVDVVKLVNHAAPFYHRLENQEDQLRLVSVSNGKDLKYALLRHQKAVARIEDALKVFSECVV